MTNVIMFRPRASRALPPEIENLMQRLLGSMDQEARRRVKVYGSVEASAELLRILALYPMFKLTHAKHARTCIFCGRRIARLELHFVKDGSYVCQSGTCMEAHK